MRGMRAIQCILVEALLCLLWRPYIFLMGDDIGLQRQSMICELLFPTSILSVKLNRKTLVVVLELEIYIYDISNMRLMHVIETTPNPDGEAILSMYVPSAS